MFSEELAIVGDLSVHVINHERFSEVVFIIGERHSLEVKGHHGSALKISKLISASSGVAINIEELGNWGSVFREIWVFSALVPFLIVVEDVVSLRGEQASEFVILENLIKNPDLINGRLSTLISYSGEGSEGEEGEVELPEHGLTHHKEGEGGVAD